MRWCCGGRPVLRATTWVLTSSLLCLSLTSCAADVRVSDVCAQFDEFADTARGLGDTDLADNPARRVRKLIGEVEADLDHLRATSEHRYDSAISVLQTTLDELSHILTSAHEEARRAVQPLIEESIQRVRDAAESLTNRVSTACADE